MKRKDLRKLIIVVSLVTALAVVVPLMSGCLGAPAAAPAAPPAAAPPAEAPPVAPPEVPKVVTAKIGFLAPLTGPVAGWGLPGFYGDEIWVEHFNAKGGITLSDGTQVLVELVPYDNEYVSEKAISGAKKMVLEDEVVMIEFLGGLDAVAAVPWTTEQFMLTTTLLPSDLTPLTLYHVAPVELHPMHNTAFTHWVFTNLHKFRPDLTEDGVITLAMTQQDDELGRGTAGMVRGIADKLDVKVVYDEFFDIETIDFAPVVSAMMATDPDIMHWGAAYPDFVILLMEQAYLQGYEGQLTGCVFDYPERIIERTSLEFVEDFVWSFPTFDDPALTPSPSPWTLVPPIVFWDEYQEKYPGTWSAVSWEYQAILDEWVQAVLYADSIDPMDVFRAWKTMPTTYHPYGEGTWWGRPLWGIDNALMSPWTVTQMVEGESRIQEFIHLLDMWEEYKDELILWNEEYDMMWYQRLGIPKETAIEMYGLEEEYK